MKNTLRNVRENLQVQQETIDRIVYILIIFTSSWILYIFLITKI